jgi:hypothetical protein
MNKQELQEKAKKKYLFPISVFAVLCLSLILISPILWVWYSFSLFIKVFVTLFSLFAFSLLIFYFFEKGIEKTIEEL